MSKRSLEPTSRPVVPLPENVHGPSPSVRTGQSVPPTPGCDHDDLLSLSFDEIERADGSVAERGAKRVCVDEARDVDDCSPVLEFDEKKFAPTNMADAPSASAACASAFGGDLAAGEGGIVPAAAAVASLASTVPGVQQQPPPPPPPPQPQPQPQAQLRATKCTPVRVSARADVLPAAAPSPRSPMSLKAAQLLPFRLNASPQRPALTPRSGDCSTTAACTTADRATLRAALDAHCEAEAQQERENIFRPRPGFEGIRKTVAEWLRDMQRAFRLSNATVGLALSYFDAAVWRTVLRQAELESVIAACMLLAAKFAEPDVELCRRLTLRSLSDCCEGGVTPVAIRHKELTLMNVVLRMRLDLVTPAHALDTLLALHVDPKLGDDMWHARVSRAASDLLSIALCNPAYWSLSPVRMALACVGSARVAASMVDSPATVPPLRADQVLCADVEQQLGLVQGELVPFMRDLVREYGVEPETVWPSPVRME